MRDSTNKLACISDNNDYLMQQSVHIRVFQALVLTSTQDVRDFVTDKALEVLALKDNGTINYSSVVRLI